MSSISTMSSVTTSTSTKSALDLLAIRQQFPALNQQWQGQQPVFLDGPGGSQVSQSVLDAMMHYLGHYNANLGGAYFSSQKTVELMHNARLAAADFYHAAHANEIVFGANATSLTFHMSRAIARDWQAGDEIIVTALDHYSNVSPWEIMAAEKGATVHHVRVNADDCTLDYDHLASLLNNKTRLVAVTYASNTTGSIVDMPKVMALVKQHSQALTYIDAVHYAPHRSLDVQALDCDFMVSSAYKYFGPHLGVLYAKASVLSGLTPYKVAPAKDVDPNRWETGTQSYEALAGYIAAIDYLASLSSLTGLSRREQLIDAFAQIEQHEIQLSHSLIQQLSDIKGIQFFGITKLDALTNRTPTIAFRIDHIEPRTVTEFFAQHQVCLWDGNFYAQGLYEQLGLSDIGGVVSIGCMHYNTQAEITRFCTLLAQLCSE